MDVKILQDVSQKERLQVLKDTAEKMEEMTYPRALDENELTVLKSQYTQDSIVHAKLIEKKKDFMVDFKAEEKPLKMTLADTMTKIRNQVEEVTEDVFYIADRDTGMMGYYNKEGVLVGSRPLLQNERQFSIIDETYKKAN